MTPFAIAFTVTFREAIAAALARDAQLPEEFYGELQRGARSTAFTVSAIESLDQIIDVLDSLNLALAEGMTFDEWRRAAADDVGHLSVGRQELVFRNAAQTAYGAGRTIQQRENADFRPFLMWDAINDSRTRPAHAAMDGHIAHIDDPVWQVWSPPAGHNCRCTRIALTERQAHARGYPMPPPAAQPDPGFEGDVAANPEEEGERLRDVLRNRLARGVPRVIREAVEAVLAK